MNFYLVIIISELNCFGISENTQDNIERRAILDSIDDLKREMVPDLNHANKYNKATVGTFFSVRDPQNAMRSFGTFISKIDWAQSESLKTLFEPFSYLGREKPIDNQIT